MSATMHRLEFMVTVADHEHWTPEHEAEADRHGGYDWPAYRLREVMAAAGQAYIDANPDLFVCELT